MVKYVLISGGVISGIGKGVIASSVGMLLRNLGYKVTAIKIDPYLNIDAGTMSPFEHGEVFILDDGGEVDLDLGNYERFLDVTLSRNNNITTGKIYQRVINKEREGGYLGKTVQVVPHICDAIQEWIEEVAQIPTSDTPPGSPPENPQTSIPDSSHPDICIIELGGTVGDIESMPFVEALRQFQFRVGRGNFAEIHVSLLPVIGAVGEQKTKPTQSSVRELRSMGLSPDLIVCRSDEPMAPGVAQKISQFCHVPQDCVIGVHNVSNMYYVPLLLNDQQICQKLLSIFHLPIPSDFDSCFQSWKTFAARVDQLYAAPPEKTLRIAMVGKYTGLTDSYLSVTKAISHASIAAGVKSNVIWIDSEKLDPESPFSKEECAQAWNDLKSAHGIIVPGGFGDRGVQGKIECCKYAREGLIPLLGICLGFQVSVIEVARNVLGWTDANSEEFTSDSTHPVVIFMPEGSRTHMGGTMRLGDRNAIFKTLDCQIAKLYNNQPIIKERHRHRYEANPKFVAEIEQKSNLRFVAQDETQERMEILELLDHPYFVGTQAHPEMKSRPMKPSPPFTGLIQAAMKYGNINPY